MENKNQFFSLWLSLVCIIFFILQNLFSGFTENLYLTQNSLQEPWRFLTAIFLHGSIVHLFYNLFALILFGIMLEFLIGSRKFLGLFLISGLVANLASFYYYPASLGASGAIMAIIGCLAVLRPLMTVWAFSLPMPMFIAAILWIGGSVMGIFGFGDQSTGYIAHLAGISTGLLYGLFLRLKYKPAAKITQQKIIIDEDSMRRWEDWHLR